MCIGRPVFQALEDQVECWLLNAHHLRNVSHVIELLSTIPGVQAHAAQVLIAECGLDMSVFPTVGHFASWAGACPGHNDQPDAGNQAEPAQGPPG